jgi:predicted enzyme related to lactoylglutathione lyase
MRSISRILSVVFALGTMSIGACSFGSDDGSLSPMQGLRTVVYAAPDLDSAKTWYTKAFGVQPYFDSANYVGFDIGGYELALDPHASVAQPPGSGPAVYWGVEDIEAELERLVGLGATVKGPLQDVGGDIKVASVLDPFGNRLGLIYNPHFSAAD